MAELNFNHFVERGIKKFMFFGEAGSGKTQIAIQFAKNLSTAYNSNVHLIDMDQTKPMYRARDAKVDNNAIIFHSGHQLLDTPVVPAGVEALLLDDEAIVVLDIGGNSMGAVQVGQYADAFQDADSSAFFVLNIYRAFSDTQDKILETISTIEAQSHIKIPYVIANPNLGGDTIIEDIIQGEQITKSSIEGIDKELFAVSVDRKWDSTYISSENLIWIDTISMY